MQIFFFGNVRIRTKMGKLFAEIRGIGVKIVANFDGFCSKQSKLSLFILSDYKKRSKPCLLFSYFIPCISVQLMGRNDYSALYFFLVKIIIFSKKIYNHSIEFCFSFKMSPTRGLYLNPFSRYLNFPILVPIRTFPKKNNCVFWPQSS